MDIDCPRCNARLPDKVVRPQFDCPFCGVRLVEKSFSALLTVIVAWGLGTLILASVIQHEFPDQTLATMLLQIAASIGMGWGLLSGIFPVLRRVEASELWGSRGHSRE